MNPVSRKIMPKMQSTVISQILSYARKQRLIDSTLHVTTKRNAFSFCVKIQEICQFFSNLSFLSLYSPVKIILYYKWTTRRLANSVETAESLEVERETREARLNISQIVYRKVVARRNEKFYSVLACPSISFSEIKVRSMSYRSDFE